MPQDSADRHVERWRDHWIDIAFDDAVELMSTRINRLDRYFDAALGRAAGEVGLQDYEYLTLHSLMIRDTPGRASPTALAKAVGVSAAGMTGRLDTLERKGWLQRVPDPHDRRRIDVEATREGVAIWRRAMAVRGDAEEHLAAALTPKELTTLNRLLKKLVLRAEGEAS